MKILIICSGNSGYISPFTEEQAKSIEALGHDVKIVPIIGKGAIGYLRAIPNLRKQAKHFNPDIIHSHYGLSGLAACFVRGFPHVITFHGSDITVPWERFLSLIVHILSDHSIFVEENLSKKLNTLYAKKSSLIPCGVNLDIFYPMNKAEARDKLGIDHAKLYALFGGSIQVKRKNYKLAQESVEKTGKEIKLIELFNKTRTEVNLLLNAVDFLLLTSHSEGSPQIIKEAMACNCPIVTSDVGDIRKLYAGINGIYICNPNPNEIANDINQLLNSDKQLNKTSTRQKIVDLNLDNHSISIQIFNLYKTLQKKNDTLPICY